MALSLGGCGRADAPEPLHSLDDPRLRDGGLPHAWVVTLDMDLTPAQQRALDAAAAGDAMPLSLAGASRVGDDIVLVRLRDHLPAGVSPAQAREWTYARDCRSGQARLLGAGTGPGAGQPGRFDPVPLAEPPAGERRRLLDLACRYRTQCKLQVRDNPCERVRRQDAPAPMPAAADEASTGSQRQ